MGALRQPFLTATHPSPGHLGPQCDLLGAKEGGGEGWYGAVLPGVCPEALLGRAPWPGL